MANQRRAAIISSVLVLLFSILPAASASIVTPVPGDSVVATAAADQIDPAIGPGPGMLLAVWADERANLTAFTEGETSSDIYGMRISSTGDFLDTVPIAIVAARASQDHPKVAWNGKNWLVVFETYDISGTGFFYTKSVAAVRVAPSGEVLDANPITFPGMPSGMWDVTANGSGWTVAGRRSAASDDIVAIRVSADGVRLDAPTTTMVDSIEFDASNLNLEYANGVHLLTFDDDVALGTFHAHSVRFDDDLNLLDPAPVLLVESATADLTSDGSNFYLVWNEFQPDLSTLLLGSRVDPSGTLLDAGGVQLAAGKQVLGTSVQAFWDGVHWRTLFDFSGELWTTRVTTAGAVVDSGGVAVPGLEIGPAAANGSGGFHVLWTDFADNNYDVYGAAVTAANVAQATAILSIGTPRQLRSDVAIGAAGMMLVYRSQTSAETRVLAQPLDLAGQALTAEPVLLDTGPGFNGPGSPAVAWNGSVYMVTWASVGRVMAQRLAADGTPLESPITVMAAGFGRNDVAALGDDFLVTGRKLGSSVEFVLPVAARVSGAGAVLDTTPLVLGAFYAGTPAVVTLGDQWLVAWHRNVSHDDSLAETMGAFIAADGTFEQAFQIHGFFSTTGGNSVFEVGLASNGTTAVMVQSQELSSGVETDLLAHTIDAAGAVSDLVNLTPWAGNQYSPRVAWDGTDFVVAYQDQKARSAAFTLSQLDARSDLFGMRLDTTGTPIDPQGFVISAEPTGESYPNVASDGATTVFSGSVVANDGVHSNYRVFYELTDMANRRPIAVMSAPDAAGDFPLTTDFSSAGSFDPDGSITTYEWDFGDGATSTEVNPTHTYTTAGAFVATLTVTDDAGTTSTQLMLVAVGAPNQLPVAAGVAVPPSGPAPLSVVFHATGSYDPDGVTGNVHWIFSDGGEYWGTPAFHTFTTEGSHFATLEVFDSRGAVGTTMVPVEVGPTNNLSPAASFTSSCTGLTCTFSDTSTDADGSIIGWDWEFGDGFVEFVANPLPHTYSVPGAYTVSLTVIDDVGATDTATTQVIVTDVIPIATAHIGDLDGAAGAVLRNRWPATVTITVHDDLEQAVSGATVDGTWSNGARGSGSCVTDTFGACAISNSRIRSSTTSATFAVDAVSHASLAYDAALDHDPDGDSDGSTIVVSQAATNTPPTAQFTWACEGATCDLDASTSSDADGSVVAYDWDFGDGAFGTGAVANHSYLADGSYSVGLTVTDDDGATASVTQVVTVGDVATPAFHVGDLDGSSLVRSRGWIARVTVTVHDEAELATEGMTVVGTWSTGAAGSCTTGGDGSCTLTLGRIDLELLSVTFVVDSVTGGTYDVLANHDDDLDSDGTSISVAQ